MKVEEQLLISAERDAALAERDEALAEVVRLKERVQELEWSQATPHTIHPFGA
jgi:hypothetical protein